MKQSPDLSAIQEAMAPGVISLVGFLGSDTRNLVDILEEDNAKVMRLGLTHQQIADRMRYFRDLGLEGLGEFMRIDDRFEVRTDSIRGKLPCPFGDQVLVSKVNTVVRNSRCNQELVYTDLQIHLIEAHGFYEGKGSPFRFEPEFIVKILEIPVNI